MRLAVTGVENGAIAVLADSATLAVAKIQTIVARSTAWFG